jgi:hypothetical protein
MKLNYRRSPAAARKIGEAFRKAARAFQGREGFLERLLAIDPATIPEGTGKHATAYVGAIVEFAAQHAATMGCGPDDEKRQDPRQFAKHFLSKRPEYSRTAAGRSASMMEAWIMEKSGYLFSRFVETVIEGRGNKFLAIFEGKLQPEEMRKLSVGIGGFMAFEMLIEAGTSNGGEIFEFTILDCTAREVKKAEQDPELQGSPRPVDSDRDVRAPSGMGRFESLLPLSREEYDSVYEEGGLTTAVLEVVAGADIFDTIVERGGRRVVRDTNGVDWIEEDGWRPDVDSLDEYETYSKPSQMPRNYRKADDEQQCATCRYWTMDGETNQGYCELFAYDVEGHMTCDLWEASQEGALGVHERAVRSDYNSWGVIDEGNHTLVMVGEQSWMVSQSFDEVMETVAAVGELYVDLPVEGDLVVEATLRDFARECGTVTERTQGQDAIFGSEGAGWRSDNELLMERNVIVKEHNARRLAAAAVHPIVQQWSRELDVPVEEANRLWEEAGVQVTEDYLDVEERSERWFALRVGAFRTAMRRAVSEKDDEDEKTGGGGKKA